MPPGYRFDPILLDVSNGTTIQQLRGTYSEQSGKIETNFEALT